VVDVFGYKSLLEVYIFVRQTFVFSPRVTADKKALRTGYFVGCQLIIQLVSHPPSQICLFVGLATTFVTCYTS